MSIIRILPVQDVTKALINKARATALTSKLVDLAGKEEDIYANLSNFIIRLSKDLKLNVKDTFDLAKAINELVKSGKDFNDVDSDALNRLPERLKQYVLQNGALKDISQEIKNNHLQVLVEKIWYKFYPKIEQDLLQCQYY